MPATNTATVAILNLYTAEKYFAKFEVECWDAAEITRIDSILVDGKWDSSTSKWIQQDAAFFNGLTMGTIYHFRARVIPQGNGVASSWSAFTPETAGDSTAPTITIASASNTATSSGVNFDLTITTSDTDIHHYEVLCKLVTIGATAPSTPAATDLPTEPKYFSNGSNHVLFTKAIADYQACYVWIRAVDTSGNLSTWTSVASYGFITDGSGNAQGQNLISNGSFELAANPGGDDTVAQGWVEIGNNLCTVALDNVNYTAGHQSLYMHQIENTSVPASTSFVCAYENSSPIYAIPGQWYVLRLKARYDRGGSAPVAGLENHIRALLEFHDGNGTYIDGTSTVNLLDADNGTGWQTLTCTFKAPALSHSIHVTLWNYVTNLTGGALSTSASFPLDARFDAVELIKAADATTDEVTKRGSVPPTYTGSLSYTSTTTSITWTWSLSVLRTDLGLTTTSVSGSQAITGLSSSTTYYFYPYLDENTLTLSMVAGGVGSPAWAQTAPSRTLTQAQNRSDRVAVSLTAITASTTSSGGGSGSGGGDGSCVRQGTYVKEKTRGIVLAETLKAGERIWSENETWLLMLHDAYLAPTDMFIHNEFNCGQILDVTTTHPWTFRDGSTKKAPAITLLDEFVSTTGIAHVINIKLLKERGDKVVVRCEYPHVFWAATVLDAPWILTHNNIDPT
jgi:hypothetical protein